MQMLFHIDEVRLEDCARYGFLGAPQFADVREHVAECPNCRDRLVEMNEFIAFLEDSDEPKTTLVQQHESSGGTVFLVMSGSDGTEWQARVIGDGHYAVKTFVRGADAQDWLEGWRYRLSSDQPQARRNAWRIPRALNS